MASRLLLRLRNARICRKSYSARTHAFYRFELVTFLYTQPTRIKLRGVPPTGSLEGFDLTPYHFQAGQVYDVPSRLAEVLVLWGYAELEIRRKSSDEAADKKRRRDD
jgi:hypothetical protein